MSLGLRAAGFRNRLAVDIDASCELTHRANLASPFLRADVSSLKARDLLAAGGFRPGELDLLAAGPPCQGLSILGSRDVADPRNDLFLAVLRMLRDVRPKYVLIENVPGLVTIGQGRFRDVISREIERSGYRFAAAELLAAQYGVPQMRWRMVFLGARSDMPMPGFPAPSHGAFPIGRFVPNRTIADEDLAGFRTAASAFDDLPFVLSGEEAKHYADRATGDEYQAAMRCGLRTELSNHYATRMSPVNIARIEALRPGQDWRDLPLELLPASMRRALRKDHTRRFRRMRWEGVPRAIVTRFRDPKTGEYIHPSQSRTISIREAARVQSFPDWFGFSGSISSQYEQVGNAVPPLMARAIARMFIDALAGVTDISPLPRTRYTMEFGTRDGRTAG